MNVRTVKLSELHADPANARKHDDRNLNAISDSLKSFGQVEPLVVQKSSGKVIGGNGRLEVLRRSGATECAVVEVDVDDTKAAALAIALNRTAELAAWDDETLARLLESLPEDMFAATGFNSDDLGELLDKLAPEHATEDVVPEPRGEAVSRAGDLWLMGDHRLLCGSSTEPDQVRRLMNGQRAALFATDPPYLVSYDGTNHPNSKKDWHQGRNKDWSKTYGTTWDEADGDPALYEKFVAVAMAEAIKPDAAWYCWHASKRQAMLEAVWEKAGAFVHQQIIWVKTRPVLTRSWYLWQHEPCFMGWVRPNKPPRHSEDMGYSVWPIDSPGLARDNGHPTSKPVEIFAIPMRQHTKHGEVCYEPFSGSGSQLIAAEQLKRRCYGVEIEGVYVDVAVRRWQTFTGLQATLDGDGRTFNELEAERLSARENAPASAEAKGEA